MVRLENLTKQYAEGETTHLVLRDVDAEFPRGQFTAIRGRSGSGKSTLLNLIAGIDVPTRGDVYVDDLCLTRLSPKQRTLFRRDHIGFVFQFFNLIPTLRVIENVMLPAELAGRDGAAARAQALELLDQVGLAGRSRSFPDQLSGGEQQRVALARALVQNPPLVLADEPTGNLDDNTGRAVMQLLGRLTHEAGKTLIMVTHSRQMAALADRTYEMHHGQLAPLDAARAA